MNDALVTGDEDTGTHTAGDPGTRHHLPGKKQGFRKTPALLTLDLGLPAFRTKRK